jgi:hypothetical protein
MRLTEMPGRVLTAPPAGNRFPPSHPPVLPPTARPAEASPLNRHLPISNLDPTAARHSTRAAANRSPARNGVPSLLAQYSAHEAPNARLNAARWVRLDGVNAIGSARRGRGGRRSRGSSSCKGTGARLILHEKRQPRVNEWRLIF